MAGITFTAIECPKPTICTQAEWFSTDSQITTPTFTQGETTTVVGKLNLVSSVADMATRYGAGYCGIGDGLGITANGTTSITVAPGHAIIGGLVEVKNPVNIFVGTVERCFVWLMADGTINTVDTVLTPPPGACMYIGSCNSNTGSATAIDASGVVNCRAGAAFRYTADEGAPTDMPPAMILFTQTLTGVYLWTGYTHFPLIPNTCLSVGGGSNSIGFFGAPPQTHTGVSAPVAMTAPSTMDATYTQTSVQDLRNDVANLHTSVATLITVLTGYGLT